MQEDVTLMTPLSCLAHTSSVVLRNVMSTIPFCVLFPTGFYWRGLQICFLSVYLLLCPLVGLPTKITLRLLQKYSKYYNETCMYMLKAFYFFHLFVRLSVSPSVCKNVSVTTLKVLKYFFFIKLSQCKNFERHYLNQKSKIRFLFQKLE